MWCKSKAEPHDSGLWRGRVTQLMAARNRECGKEPENLCQWASPLAFASSGSPFYWAVPSSFRVDLYHQFMSPTSVPSGNTVTDTPRSVLYQYPSSSHSCHLDNPDLTSQSPCPVLGLPGSSAWSRKEEFTRG